MNAKVANDYVSTEGVLGEFLATVRIAEQCGDRLLCCEKLYGAAHSDLAEFGLPEAKERLALEMNHHLDRVDQSIARLRARLAEGA